MCELTMRSQWALTVLRIFLGSVFIAHGSQKVFGWLGGAGLEGFVNWLSSSNVPSYLGYAAAYFELIGGICLVLGLFTEFAAALTIPVMLGAIYLVHGSKGFFVQNGGYEYALTLLIMSIVIIIGGPGYFALWSPCLCCRV